MTLSGGAQAIYLLLLLGVGVAGGNWPAEVGVEGRPSRPQQGGAVLPPLDGSTFPNEVLCCLGARRIGC